MEADCRAGQSMPLELTGLLTSATRFQMVLFQLGLLPDINELEAKAIPQPLRSLSMKHVVTMHSERRSAIRREIGLGTSIEDADIRTAVVLLDEISAAGFRMVSVVPLILGNLVTVELPRIGRRSAKVVWQSGVRFGCAFVTPITTEDLQEVMEAGAERHALRQHRAESGWRPGAAALAA